MSSHGIGTGMLTLTGNKDDHSFSMAFIYEKLDSVDKRIILKAIRECGSSTLYHIGEYSKMARKREFNKIPFMNSWTVLRCLEDYRNSFDLSRNDCNVERYKKIRRMIMLIENVYIRKIEV